jgi:hypothetical protein
VSIARNNNLARETFLLHIHGGKYEREENKDVEEKN